MECAQKVKMGVIRHHAKEAGLPEETWQTFTELPPDDPSAEERQKKAKGLVERIEQSNPILKCMYSF